MGLFLQKQGVPFTGNERAGVYLTNALTGWEQPQGARQQLGFPELEAERSSAERVKQAKPILVVLGNPPYNGFAGVSPAEERGLVEPYKNGLRDWGITKNYLDDLYVRFFRLAERRVAEMTRQGIVCYISNFSYLADPSFVVMRQRFLAQFDCLWFDCLNGDSRETGKRTPNGLPDPSIFSTPFNESGIRVGTSIALLVRKAAHQTATSVSFREFWGANKRADLLSSLPGGGLARPYAEMVPCRSTWFSFRPVSGATFEGWPRVSELSSVEPMLGLNENRGGALRDIDKQRLEQRMRMYYDDTVDWTSLSQLGTGLTADAAGFNALRMRTTLRSVKTYLAENMVRFWFKPFDLQWAYIERMGNLWNRPRPELLDQAWEGNQFLLARRHAPKSKDGAAFFFSRRLADQHVLHTDAYFIPLHVRTRQPAPALQGDLLGGPSATANLSAAVRAYLAALGMPCPDVDANAAELVWLHVLAIGYSPAYLAENADGIRQDWPRVPLPAERDDLLASAALGRQLATLLDTESKVAGVTDGSPRLELRAIGVITRAGGGSLNPAAGDLAVTAGWGHGGQGGVTMPGQGRLMQRAYDQAELAAIEAGARALGLSLADALAELGEGTYDVYLNDVAYWRNVPVNVWRYTIGGYQVMKKWLSYREKSLLGRDLKVEEAREVCDMARRLAAILLLQPQLDENYRRAKANSYSWPGGA